MEEKEVFERQHAENMEVYRKDYKEWFAKAIKEGNGALLPKAQVRQYSVKIIIDVVYCMVMMI